jgi:DNA-binding Lrp family transcriptional regulator
MDENQKFRVKADLALFEAIQHDGRLSEEAIAQKTKIPATTVHYAMDRIRQRDFFKIMAVPMLEKFSEIPMAVIGFSNAHPFRIKELVQKYSAKPEIVQLLHSERDVLLVVMEPNKDALTKRLYEIMQFLDEKPSIYITSPTIAKFSPAIPDKVLESAYSDLPDRRIKA